MRFSILIAFCSFISLDGLAQEQRLLVGGSLGLNTVGAWNRSEPASGEIQPRLGWSGSAVVSYDMGKRLRLAGQLGGVVEKKREVSLAFDGGFDGTYSYTYDSKYSWGEASALISYMPIRGKIFGLFTGTGFSTRRLISAAGQTHIVHAAGAGTSSGTFDVYDLMYKWSYLLPFQLGATFDLAESGRVMIATEYQLGLRSLFKPTPYNDATLFDYGWDANKEKPQSISVKVAYLFKI